MRVQSWEWVQKTKGVVGRGAWLEWGGRVYLTYRSGISEQRLLVQPPACHRANAVVMAVETNNNTHHLLLHVMYSSAMLYCRIV